MGLERAMRSERVERYASGARELTRLTYAFSRKWENLRSALALHFAHYNFCRVHGSLRITPAMAAGITNRVWTMEELIGP